MDQYDSLCPLGPYTKSKGTESPLCFVFALLHFTLVGNLLIVVTIAVNKSLDSPMYFFLACLSFMGAIYSSSISPKLISNLFFGENISFKFCVGQVFIGHSLGGSEVIFPLAMACDCYVAIYKPLHYLVIMRQWVCVVLFFLWFLGHTQQCSGVTPGSMLRNCSWQAQGTIWGTRIRTDDLLHGRQTHYLHAIFRALCVVLLIMLWIEGFLHSTIQLSTIYGLSFCDPNVIDHFICDMYPLLKLICADIYVIGILVVVNGGLICSIVFLHLLIPYVIVLYSLKNLSQEGRWKALQTCGSHLIVVLFFVPCIFMYAKPAKTFPIDKSLRVFYTVITPILNPLICTLTNSVMTNAMKKFWSRIVSIGK